MRLTRRAALVGVGAALLGRARAQGAGVDLAGSVVRFADVETGRALLGAEDDWMRATSEFQRRAVMGRPVPVSLEAFREWNMAAVRPWDDAGRDRWSRALRALAPGFEELRIPLPPQVWLVSTNGQESAEAPYTRGNGVMLAGDARVPGYSDAMLLAHELWHTAARHDPALATRLYAEIGFEPMPLLSFPPAWEPIRIANPDAPGNRHAIRIVREGRPARVMPVLVASRTALRPGESFFDVMQPRLLEVEPDPSGSRSQAVLEGGRPVWHPIDGPHDYLQRLGGNTAYVIHPEEAMADNVALLATGTRPRNTGLAERLRAVFDARR